MKYWWCLTHSRVEGSPNDDDGCANVDRLGPYASQEQAAGALDSTRARTAAQDAKDEAEDDWGER